MICIDGDHYHNWWFLVLIDDHPVEDATLEDVHHIGVHLELRLALQQLFRSVGGGGGGRFGRGRGDYLPFLLQRRLVAAGDQVEGGQLQLLEGNLGGGSVVVAGQGLLRLQSGQEGVQGEELFGDLALHFVDLRENTKLEILYKNLESCFEGLLRDCSGS